MIIIVIVIIIAGKRATVGSALLHEKLLWFLNILVIAVNQFTTIASGHLIGIALTIVALNTVFNGIRLKINVLLK